VSCAGRFVSSAWGGAGLSTGLLCALLLMLPATGSAGTEGLGWTMDFHTSDGMGCGRIEEALALGDDDWRSPRELSWSGSALRGSALWVRLQPQVAQTSALLVLRWEHNATLVDWRDAGQRRQRHSPGHAPGFTVVSLPSERQEPLLLCLLAPTPRAESFSIMSPPQLQAAERRVVLLMAMLSGVILASVALGLAYFLRLRTASFLLFSLFSLSMLAWLLSQFGALHVLMPVYFRSGPLSYALLIVLGALTTAVGVRFSLPFAGIDRWQRLARLLRVLSHLVVIGGVGALMQLPPFEFGPWVSVAGLIIHNLSIGLILCLTLALAGVSAWRGHHQARLYLLGWMPLILLLLVKVLVILGALPHSAFPSPPWTLSAAAFASLLLCWGLIDRIRRDRAERDEAIARASRDPLTGASSRAALEALLETTTEGDLLLYLDIDHFKQINDRHGHGVGDQCLRRFAQGCRGQLRGMDGFGRQGGEEFLAVLPRTDPDEGLRVAERIRAAVAEPAAGEPAFTVSIGIAARQCGESVKDWIARADAALYRAKAEGRDRVVVADSDPGPAPSMPTVALP